MENWRVSIVYFRVCCSICMQLWTTADNWAASDDVLVYDLLQQLTERVSLRTDELYTSDSRITASVRSAPLTVHGPNIVL